MGGTQFAWGKAQFCNSRPEAIMTEPSGTPEGPSEGLFCGELFCLGFRVGNVES